MQVYEKFGDFGQLGNWNLGEWKYARSGIMLDWFWVLFCYFMSSADVCLQRQSHPNLGFGGFNSIYRSFLS